MKVYQLISKHQKWCKKDYAKNSFGNRTDPYSNDAVRFCLVGAISKCYGNKLYNQKLQQFQKYHKFRTVEDVFSFNDNHDWKTIYQACKLANI